MSESILMIWSIGLLAFVFVVFNGYARRHGFVHLILFILFCIPCDVFASDFYYAATSAGSSNGTSCANAYAYDDGTNGWNAATKQTTAGNGNTLHSCGAFTFSANANPFTFGASGSAVTPIKLVFETGSSWAAPYFSTSRGAIHASGSQAYIEVDGGVECGQTALGVTTTCNGSITATDNGSSPTYGNSQDTGAFYCVASCAHIRVHNLLIANMFVKNTADTQGAGWGIDCHYCSNVRIDHNIIHDVSAGIVVPVGSTSATAEYDHNVIYNINHGIQHGGVNTGVISSTFLTHDNEIYDFSNWDDPVGNNFHHNAYFEFDSGSVNVTGVQIYNNYIHGNPGVFNTSAGFNLTGSFHGDKVFNNILMYHTNGLNNGAISTGLFAVESYNNIVGYEINIGGKCYYTASGAPLTIKNTIFINCGVALYLNGGYSDITASDYNDFFGTTFFGPGAADNATLASWRTACSCDSHSINTDPGLTAFVPTTGSNVYHTGVDLSGLGITALNTSLNGVARGSGSPWTIGAMDAIGSGQSFNGRSLGFFFFLLLTIACLDSAKLSALPLVEVVRRKMKYTKIRRRL